MDSQNQWWDLQIEMTSYAHFPRSPVIEWLKFQKTSCSNPHRDLGQIKVTVLVVFCPFFEFFFRVPRTSLLLFSHQIQASGLLKTYVLTSAPAPQGHHVLAENVKQPWRVHGQSALCFVGCVADLRINSWSETTMFTTKDLVFPAVFASSGHLVLLNLVFRTLCPTCSQKHVQHWTIYICIHLINYCNCC